MRVETEGQTEEGGSTEVKQASDPGHSGWHPHHSSPEDQRLGHGTEGTASATGMSGREGQREGRGGGSEPSLPLAPAPFRTTVHPLATYVKTTQKGRQARRGGCATGGHAGAAAVPHTGTSCPGPRHPLQAGLCTWAAGSGGLPPGSPHLFVFLFFSFYLITYSLSLGVSTSYGRDSRPWSPTINRVVPEIPDTNREDQPHCFYYDVPPLFYRVTFHKNED